MILVKPHYQMSANMSNYQLSWENIVVKFIGDTW
jgi:hypothetical protein